MLPLEQKSRWGHFRQFWAYHCQKTESVKVIYIYEIGSSYYSLSENDMV